MDNGSESDNKVQRKIKIYAYGFERIGFDIPKVVLIEGTIEKVFLKFNDTRSLDEADGVIIPQGIFEQILDESTFMTTYTSVKFDKAQLLERERQVFNILKDKNWVCFLVGKIIDVVPQERGKETIRETDLCKKFLNYYGIDRSTVGYTTLQATQNEFINYIRNFGVAKSEYFIRSSSPEDRRVLVKFGRSIVGFEFFRNIFFLPFHTTKKDSSTAESLVQTVAEAIIDYRQKTVVNMPPWLDEFKFNKEGQLESEIEEIRLKQTGIVTELNKWKKYKIILTSSGENLKKIGVEIFREFFQLIVDPIDEGREDAKILDNDSNPIVLIEFKGTNKGVSREHINQVDSHRERNNLPPDFPGVLIINNQMNIAGIKGRMETEIAEEHIKHAKNIKVLIMRAIDLLLLMKQLESNSERGKIMLSLILEKSGWLKVNEISYGIISGNAK